MLSRNSIQLNLCPEEGCEFQSQFLKMFTDHLQKEHEALKVICFKCENSIVEIRDQKNLEKHMSQHHSEFHASGWQAVKPKRFLMFAAVRPDLYQLCVSHVL